MFGHKKDDDAAHHLLSGDRALDEEQSHGVVWDQASSASERNISNDSDIWEHDPMQERESHELKEVRAPHQPGRRTRRMEPETHGEAVTELDEQFQRIFSPMKKDQEEKTRFYGDLDDACAAYSARLEEMQERQRDREGTIEKPWLAARRRREWERFIVTLQGFGTVATCFWGGTVGSLDEVPPRIPWPPPDLTRMKEDHKNEKKALSDAHLSVVDELRKKYMFELDEDGEPDGKHVCIERRLLRQVAGDGPVPTDDVD